MIKVTPDPGVIEVNIQPAQNWREAVDITFGLYEDAAQTRLGTNKFLVDGRHTGTGGGNHVVVGGSKPAGLAVPAPSGSAQEPRAVLAAASLAVLPVLRHVHRPDQPGAAHRRSPPRRALRTGNRAGPCAAAGVAAPLWLVDRLFRHILVDITGNTHRAEICIDKLYSPDGTTGRLGLVEFRALEMPPDPRMSLAQQLLIRALIAKLWREPQQGKFVRWGTTLHDRFMLPHFLWEDFSGVLADLSSPAMISRPDWFAAQLEFRFPVFGRVHHGGVSLEVRQALEPWHVLARKAPAGGTVRYVDSSVERLQVKARALSRAATSSPAMAGGCR